MVMIDSTASCIKVYRLLYKLLNLLEEIMSKYHNSSLVIYAALCKLSRAKSWT